MCLRFLFLLIMRLATWLRLSRREETWKTAEILILRHQLTVLQRRQPRRPKLNWTDRALLATLLSVIPNARRHGLRLLVAPDTILRWHRDIVRRRWAARSMRGNTGRPATLYRFRTRHVAVDLRFGGIGGLARMGIGYGVSPALDQKTPWPGIGSLSSDDSRSSEKWALAFLTARRSPRIAGGRRTSYRPGTGSPGGCCLAAG
jgi:hypothetical protein